MQLHVRLIFYNRNVALLKYPYFKVKQYISISFQQKYTTQIILFPHTSRFLCFFLYSTLFTIPELVSYLHKDHFVLFHSIDQTVIVFQVFTDDIAFTKKKKKKERKKRRNKWCGLGTGKLNLLIQRNITRFISNIQTSLTKLPLHQHPLAQISLKGRL